MGRMPSLPNQVTKNLPSHCHQLLDLMSQLKPHTSSFHSLCISFNVISEGPRVNSQYFIHSFSFWYQNAEQGSEHSHKNTLQKNHYWIRFSPPQAKKTSPHSDMHKKPHKAYSSQEDQKCHLLINLKNTGQVKNDCTNFSS